MLCQYIFHPLILLEWFPEKYYWNWFLWILQTFLPHYSVFLLLPSPNLKPTCFISFISVTDGLFEVDCVFMVSPQDPNVFFFGHLFYLPFHSLFVTFAVWSVILVSFSHNSLISIQTVSSELSFFCHFLYTPGKENFQEKIYVGAKQIQFH